MEETMNLDYFTFIPDEIANLILSFLDAYSLIKCQLVSRKWYQLADDYKLWTELCLQLWAGKFIANNTRKNFNKFDKTVYKPPSIYEMKLLMAEYNIPFKDCIERKDLEQRFALVPVNRNKNFVNYLQPGYPKRLKEIYFQSIRDFKIVFINREELCDYEWQMKFKYDVQDDHPYNYSFSDFRRDYVYCMNGHYVGKWRFIKHGMEIQIEQYPPLKTSRGMNGEWILENEHVTITSINTRKLIDSSQPVTIDVKLKAAQACKERGNELFKEKEYLVAITEYERVFKYIEGVNIPAPNRYEVNQLYTFWINLQKSTHLNIALCYSKLKQYRGAITHCHKVIRLDPDSVKALFLRGQALMEIKEYEQALRDFTAVNEKIGGSDKTVLAKLQSCKQLYEKKLEEERKNIYNLLNKNAV